MDRNIRSVEDVLRLLDGLFGPEADRWTNGASSWWDGFYQDRARPVLRGRGDGVRDRGRRAVPAGQPGGGPACTAESLRRIFSGLTEVELRRMGDEPPQSPYFGEPFLWTALFRRDA